ncbi:MAG: hypothetical protein ACK5KQ_00380 [Anaerorhabdus sp.]
MESDWIYDGNKTFWVTLLATIITLFGSALIISTIFPIPTIGNEQITQYEMCMRLFKSLLEEPFIIILFSAELVLLIGIAASNENLSIINYLKKSKQKEIFNKKDFKNWVIYMSGIMTVILIGTVYNSGIFILYYFSPLWIATAATFVTAWICVNKFKIKENN